MKKSFVRRMLLISVIAVMVTCSCLAVDSPVTVISSSGSSKLEAEDFMLDGQDVSFHENTYQTEDVYQMPSAPRPSDPNDSTTYVPQTRRTNDGGYFLSYATDPEWLKYQIKVEKGGAYTVSAYCARGYNGGGLTLTVEDTKDTVTIPYTDVKNTQWIFEKTGEYSITLPEGEHILKLDVSWPWDIDYFEFTSSEPEEEKVTYRMITRAADGGFWDKESAEPLTLTVMYYNSLGQFENLKESFVNRIKLNGAYIGKDVYTVTRNEDRTLTIEIDADFLKENCLDGENTLLIFYDADSYLHMTAAFDTTVDPDPNLETEYVTEISGDATRLEMENWMNGGNGVAFNDDDYTAEDTYAHPRAPRPSNERQLVPQTRLLGDGNYAVIYMQDPDWLKFKVNIEEGTYAIAAYAGTNWSSGNISLYLDDEEEPFAILPASTLSEDWTMQLTSAAVASLPAGEHTIKVSVFGPFDIDYIEFNKAE